MKYEVNKMVLSTVCQKCNVIPAKVPLVDLEMRPGILFIPDILHCANCGAQLTVQVREYTKAELEKKEELKATITIEEAKTEVGMVQCGAVDTIARLNGEDCAPSTPEN